MYKGKERKYKIRKTNSPAALDPATKLGFDCYNVPVLGLSDGPRLDPLEGWGSPRNSKFPGLMQVQVWVNAQVPPPGEVLHCLLSHCGSQGTLGGSDGLWSLLRHGPGPPGSAVEPGMAHGKGWKPPGLCGMSQGWPGGVCRAEPAV